MNRSRFKPLVLLAWLAALVVAAMLDANVAGFVRSSGVEAFMNSHKALRHVLKVPGEYWFTIVVMLAFLFHRRRWRASVLVLLGTTLSGVNGLTKWMVGRIRPFKLFDDNDVARLAPFDLHPFIGGLHGLFGGVKNLCFPSGHAALAFATAAALAMLWPKSRWRWGFYAVAAVVAAERVLENAHWLSDTVAGAALGVGGVHLIRWLLVKFTVDEREQDRDALTTMADTN